MKDDKRLVNVQFFGGCRDGQSEVMTLFLGGHHLKQQEDWYWVFVKQGNDTATAKSSGNPRRQ